MHYRGFVIVPNPTDEDVAVAMAPHQEAYDKATETSSGHWDWYRCGGRYDGYLISDAEMTARETDNGFNFQPENKRVDRNVCRVRDLPADRREVYFFVVDGDWVDRESWDSNAPSKWDENGKGAFVETPDFSGRLDAALASHMDDFVVVIDAHS